jgi:RNA polymerase sigma-70 factor (subfamily 1)
LETGFLRHRLSKTRFPSQKPGWEMARIALERRFIQWVNHFHAHRSPTTAAVRFNQGKAMPNRPGKNADRLESYRAVLLGWARCRMDGRLRQWLNPADIVQQTLLQALENIDQFRGHTDAQLAVWLRRILDRVLSHAVRDGQRRKRNPAREKPLGHATDVASKQPPPSLQVIRAEDHQKLLQALLRLPDDQRQAVRLLYLDGLTIKEICRQLGRTAPSVRGLIRRGQRKLRVFLGEGERIRVK